MAFPRPNYTIVPHALLLDKRLSFGSLAILVHVMEQNRPVTPEILAKFSCDDEEVVLGYLNELKDLCYMKKEGDSYVLTIVWVEDK